MELSIEIVKALHESGLDRQTVENMLSHYRKMRWEYAMADHEAVGMHAGKFCENASNLVLSILTGQMEERPQLGNVLTKIDKAQPNTQVDDMIRVTIPRMLRAVYELRSKRGTVHVNLRMKVNEIDSKLTLDICSWILAEFLRVYHSSDMDIAWKLIDRVSKVQLPFIDEYRGKKLIMNAKLSVPEEVLLHLINAGVEVPVDELIKWIPNADRNHVLTVLRQLHDKRLVHYDEGFAKITPLGATEAGRLISELQPTPTDLKELNSNK
ncbi:MAG: hypothetical protein HYW25_01055 [Candidatus Aenigmarchaeota archaeon]|nr:hypothetical protein [Candidatus Aenigmarchaeota archaeon]